MDSKQHAQVTETHRMRAKEWLDAGWGLVMETEQRDEEVVAQLLADALDAEAERVRRETLEFLNSLPVRTSLGDAIRALAQEGTGQNVPAPKRQK